MKILSPILLLLLTFTLAQETATEQQRRASVTEDTKTVVATGMGVDREAALKQALRNAVEQAIGVFLKTETVVENLQLINDEILTHSRGYVQSFDIINEGQADGLYSMSLSAVVIVKELESALVELRLYTRPIEGETLFAKAFTQISETRDAISLYKDLRNDYPRNSVRVVFGEPNIKTNASDEVEVSIPYTLEWANGYLTQLRDVLEETSEATANTRAEKESLEREYGYPHAPVHLIDNRPNKTGETVYLIKVILADELIKKYGKQGLFVSLEDANGNVIASWKFKVPTRLFRVWSDRGNFVGGRTVYIRGVYYYMVEQPTGSVRNAKFTLILEELRKVVSVTGLGFNY